VVSIASSKYSSLVLILFILLSLKLVVFLLGDQSVP
jgi:hypothetical protein